jgi:MFS family permease
MVRLRRARRSRLQADTGVGARRRRVRLGSVRTQPPDNAAMPTARLAPAARRMTFALVVLATVLSMVSTDLLLPAIPELPRALRGTPEQAQLALAAFVAGFAAGLLALGELGARWNQQKLLAASLLAFAALSVLAASAASLPMLVALRLLQGLAAAAGAAFAPGVIRRIFDPADALKAIGLQGSLESLAPALGPIAGAWLLHLGGWTLSFHVLAVAAVLLAVLAILAPADAFPPAGSGEHGHYLHLLRNREFTRQGLSHACSLGALLVIVFAAPAVLVNAWGGPLAHFLRLQVVGVATFIAAVQVSNVLVRRWGAERVVLAGSTLCAGGCVLVLAYALAGGRDALVLTGLCVIVNAGFGLRGPPGFLAAIVAARGDDSRAAALVVLGILLLAAGGTSLAAPWITLGLAPAAAVAAGLALASPVLLLALAPRQAPPRAASAPSDTR